jgi:hypothetical protein
MHSVNVGSSIGLSFIVIIGLLTDCIVVTYVTYMNAHHVRNAGRQEAEAIDDYLLSSCSHSRAGDVVLRPQYVRLKARRHPVGRTGVEPPYRCALH